MNTYTIYEVISDDGEYVYDLYMVPGDAKADYCNRHIAMEDWPSDGQISESMGTIFLSNQKLISEIALEELFGDDCSVFLYTVWANTRLHSHWYENEDAAANSSDGKKILEAGGSVIKRMLHKQKRFPVTLPMTVQLMPGSKGPYIQINLRPDIDGDSAGKFYFPDRSCGPVSAGLFTITAVKEHGTYGFLFGHMVSISAPDEMELTKYLVENLDDVSNSNLRFIRHPAYGSFVEIRDSQNFRKCCTPAHLVKLNDEIFTFSNFSNIYEVKSAEEIKFCSVKDFLCEKLLGCTYEAVRSEFAYPDKLAPFIPSFVQKSEKSPKFVSSEFDKAQKLGFICLRRFQNIDFVDIDWSKLLLATVALKNEELWNLIESIKKLNEDTCKKFLSLIRKGKIRATPHKGDIAQRAKIW